MEEKENIVNEKPKKTVSGVVVIIICLVVCAIVAPVAWYFETKMSDKEANKNTTQNVNVNTNLNTTTNTEIETDTYLCLAKDVKKFDLLTKESFVECELELGAYIDMEYVNDHFNNTVYYAPDNMKAGESIALDMDGLLFEAKKYENGSTIKLEDYGNLVIKDKKLLFEKNGGSKTIFDKEPIKFVSVYTFYDSTGETDIIIYTENKSLYKLFMSEDNVDGPLAEYTDEGDNPKLLLSSVNVVKIISEESLYPGPYIKYVEDGNGNFKEIDMW